MKPIDVQDPKSSAVTAYEEYMARVGKEKIPAYEPSVGREEAELLADVIQRNWLSESTYTREFEGRLARLCRRRYALAFCNATAALIAGMRAVGIAPGDEVIVPSFSHPADPNSVAATGAVPVFADVDEQTLCLSPETIDAVTTNRTKAILLVNLYGNAPDMQGIVDYAAKRRLLLINDCAAALGSTYRGTPLAAYGEFAALSFFADKTITTGEGGMLLTDRDDVVNESNVIKHDGRRERGTDVIEQRGYNFRITELQTAVGVAQLNKLGDLIGKKKRILQAYRQRLSRISDVRLFEFSPEGDIVPHRVLIFVPEATGLITALTSAGIGARGTMMPMHRQPCYKLRGAFPVTESLYARGVCLPSAPTLTDRDIDVVVESIRRYYQPEAAR